MSTNEQSINQLTADYVAAVMALDELCASPVSTELELALAMRLASYCHGKVQTRLSLAAETWKEAIELEISQMG